MTYCIDNVTVPQDVDFRPFLVSNYENIPDHMKEMLRVNTRSMIESNTPLTLGEKQTAGHALWRIFHFFACGPMLLEMLDHNGLVGVAAVRLLDLLPSGDINVREVESHAMAEWITAVRQMITALTERGNKLDVLIKPLMLEALHALVGRLDRVLSCDPESSRLHLRMLAKLDLDPFLSHFANYRWQYPLNSFIAVVISRMRDSVVRLSESDSKRLSLAEGPGRECIEWTMLKTFKLLAVEVIKVLMEMRQQDLRRIAPSAYAGIRAATIHHGDASQIQHQQPH